jgi:hypothetical protein
MPQYRVQWTSVCTWEAYVRAESPEQAIALAGDGTYPEGEIIESELIEEEDFRDFKGDPNTIALRQKE